MIDSTINKIHCCNSITFQNRYYAIGDRKIQYIEHPQEHKNNLIKCRLLHDKVDDNSGCRIKSFFNNDFDEFKKDFDFIEIFTIDENNKMYILFQNCKKLNVLIRILEKYKNTTISIMYISRYGVSSIQNLKSTYKNLSVNIYRIAPNKELIKL